MFIDLRKIVKLSKEELDEVVELKRRYDESFDYMRKNTIAINDEFDPWTDEERKLLTLYFREGFGISTIALFLHRTEPAVMNQIRALHLYGRRGP